VTVAVVSDMMLTPFLGAVAGSGEPMAYAKSKVLLSRLLPCGQWQLLAHICVVAIVRKTAALFSVMTLRTDARLQRGSGRLAG
jgi:hypothetical protein